LWLFVNSIALRPLFLQGAFLYLCPMAYGLKYTITAPQINSGTTYQAKIYEQDYVGSSSAISVDKFPFEHTLLALSDDAYLPIVPSQLTLKLNITGNTTLPDLTSTNDRKLFIEFYEGLTIIWQGFIISDNIALPFNTGFINLSIQCTDGLGLLKDIEYKELITDINDQVSIAEMIRNCLGQIAWPNGYTINTAFNLYHIDMIDTDSALEQMYLSNRYTQGKTCYEVLEGICQSLACQIYQSDGEWWFVAVNERTTILRYFTTDQDGAGTGTANTINPSVNIGSATDTYHFIDGGQRKVLRKGFSIVEVNKSVSTGENFINNADLSNLTAGFPTLWTKIELSGGSVSAQDNVFNMSVAGGASAIARVQCDSGFSVAGITGSDIKNRINISFTITQPLTTSTNPAIILIVKLFVPSTGDTWYLEADSSAPDSPYFNNYGTSGLEGLYRIAYDEASTAIGGDITKTININDIVIPLTGIVDIKFALYRTTGSGQPATQQTALISDFKVTTSTDLKEEALIANIGGDKNKFKRSIETEIGVGLGTLSRIPDIVGSILKERASIFVTNEPYSNDWYDYLTGSVSSPIDYTTLILNRFTQILFKASINIEGTVRSYLKPNNSVSLTDGTGQYSVSGKKYILGQTTTNYIDDTSSINLLETSQTDIINFSTDLETVSTYGRTN
jgi:hypothetical protein